MRQDDDPGNDAREQQGQLRAIGDGHGHAEDDQAHGLGPPGIAGGPYGHGHGGHGQGQGAGEADRVSACTPRCR